MKSWKVFKEGDWNKFQEKLDTESYLQFFEWGEYKKSFQENVLRFACYEDGDLVSSFQCSAYKKFGLLTIIWIPGDLPGRISDYDKDLLNYLKSFFKTPYIVLRSFIHRENIKELRESLKSIGWNESAIKMDSGQTMKLSLSDELDEIRKGFRKSFRHNLNRYEKRLKNVQVNKNTDSHLIRAVYADMESNKALQTQYTEKELDRLFKIYGEKIHVVTSAGVNGKVAAFRACVVYNRKGWDFLAASNDEARNNYATFGLMWNVIEYCHSKGVVNYDMAGIDKKNNKGVYNFKRGTGASEFNYLGEWEISSSSGILFLFNLLLRIRNKLK